VLKGRNPKGVWEEIDVYDKPVSSADIAEVIDEYREKGYDYFRLDVYDSKGRYVRREWSRKYPAKKSEDALDSLLEKLTKYNDVVEKLKKALGIKELDPLDVVATLMYYEELKKKLAEVVTPKEGGLREVEEFLKLLKALREVGLVGTPTAPTTPTATPTAVPATPKPAEAKAEELEEAILREVEEKLKPPCAEEKCVEGEVG
jgi:hypothetical protein